MKVNTLIEDINWTIIIGFATVILVGVVIPIVMNRLGIPEENDEGDPPLFI